MTITYAPPTPFRDDLESEAAAFFEKRGVSRHGSYALWLNTWFIGGLNFQIEHHLFPRVCHAHYPALSKIVERVCLKHGVRYVAHATAGKALRSHYRWLRLLGRA
jgi:fatty acid desaturase